MVMAVCAFSRVPAAQSRRETRKTRHINNFNLRVTESDNAPQPEWGASYIGGDPCGSKYNTDPHDARVEKPGMPDDMKARIAALAEKKLRESQQRQEEEKEE